MEPGPVVDLVGLMSELMVRTRQATIATLMQSGGLLMASQTGPEDAMLSNGIMADNEFCEVCLFDDEAAGFDDGEAGFA